MKESMIEKYRSIVIKKHKLTMANIISIEDKDKFISEFIKTEKFDNLYNMLEDEYSKYLLEKNVRNRYILAFNKGVCHNLKKEIIFGLKCPVTSTLSWILKFIHFIVFKRASYPKEIGAWALFHVIRLEQYNIKNIFEVKDDAIVFDIGAYRGDTAYYFSKNCNKDAQIYCFEPDNNAFEILKNVCKKYNLDNTKQYNILFLDRQKKINFTNMGNLTVEKEAITVDDFILANNITRLDFIKMDVEGAEKTILEGGKNAIKTLRPALAIAIYHGGDLFFEDFITVPTLIKNITPNYKYFLRSFIPWGGEVILYCIPNK